MDVLCLSCRGGTGVPRHPSSHNSTMTDFTGSSMEVQVLVCHSPVEYRLTMDCAHCGAKMLFRNWNYIECSDCGEGLRNETHMKFSPSYRFTIRR